MARSVRLVYISHPEESTRIAVMSSTSGFFPARGGNVMIRRLGFQLAMVGLLLCAAGCDTAVVTRRAYFPNGQLREEWAEDSSGRITGAYIEFWPNGKVRSRTKYRAGSWAGETDRYDQAGQLQLKIRQSWMRSTTWIRQPDGTFAEL